MRLGVLDVGSNTVHLLVVDARTAARGPVKLDPKATLRLAEPPTTPGKIASAEPETS